MSSFLIRIKEAIEAPENTRGLRNKILVELKDLKELVVNFERIDSNARVFHALREQEKSFSGTDFKHKDEVADVSAFIGAIPEVQFEERPEMPMIRGNMPRERLAEDLLKGLVWLEFDLFKDSGKWAYGGVVRLHVQDLLRVQWDSDALLDYIEKRQSQVCVGTFKHHTVVLSDAIYNAVEDYHLFFTRMFPRRA